MAELTVVAKATAKPGHEAEFERELRKVTGLTHQEPGCLRYTLHRSMDDPASFVVIERWASREALNKHFVAPYVQALLMKVPDLLVGPPEIKVFEQLPEGQLEKGAL